MSLRRINAIAAEWLAAGGRVAAATLIAAEGSSPFEPGATMLVDERGRIEGSVTGGCVEGALFEEAETVLGGGPPRVRTYGISDTQAGEVGLTCGGTVHVFVRELGPGERELLEAVERAVACKRPAALAVLVDGERAGASLAVADGQRVGSLARATASIARSSAMPSASSSTARRRCGAMALEAR